MPSYREGIGDATGRMVKDPHGRGWLEYRYAPGWTCEIVNIEVGEKFRRQGVGRQLVKELVHQCEGNERADVIYVVTRRENKIAQEFYEGIGFRKVADLPMYYPDGDAVMYGRRV